MADCRRVAIFIGAAMASGRHRGCAAGAGALHWPLGTLMESTVNLLLIEDDPLVAEGILAGLELGGARICWAADLRRATPLCVEQAWDTIILDLSLPDGDGLEWLRQQRQRGVRTPVLILTARDAIPQRVAGLNAGADDYLTKPFDLDELIARVRALHRRAQPHLAHVIEHGPLRVQLEQRRVLWHDQPVTLSRREWVLLEALLRARGALLSAAQLHERLYDLDTQVESNALNVHLYNLRRKLDSRLVITERNLGYRLASLAELEDNAP
ncbi:response regulator transcription factor [Isoalcanivorax beigongshangi]|uniref:Response regulator transcription factor n=1 Tax=Isoalcanivorax beigongshangi TaxID=3238810 RepID=A0ABV4AI74_9GAMM